MIVATAGHIDHGKTALVKALTGIDADRLPEEKARGITVDLGFAYACLGARRIGFVDVPGHERLVRTMVAGATGVGFALLVVAADDGVMPQTREHLAILDLLGLRRGLVAITKSDRAGPGRLADVTAQVRAALAGTGLADAPILPCSARDGTGIADLARRLEAEAEAPPLRAGDGDFRLAVDRCFTVAGAGLVVTGAVHSGTVRTGDHLLVSPGAVAVRVRGLRAEDAAAESAGAGQRCALNLTGPRLSRADIHRGAWILAPNLHAPARRLDVALRLLPGEARPLRHRTPVHLHLGAASATGRVLLPAGVTIAPGGEARVQIALDGVGTRQDGGPGARTGGFSARTGGFSALQGDRFVLRDISAARTLGGGRVIDGAAPQRGAWAPGRRALVEALDTPDHAAALAGVLALSAAGVDLDHFARSRNRPPAAMTALARDLGLVAVATPRGPLGFARARIDRLGAAILAILVAAHRAEPDNPGLAAAEIGERLPAAERPALRAALGPLLDRGDLAQSGPLYHRPDHAVRLAPPEAALYEAVRTVLEAAGLDQPRLAELATSVGRDPDALRPLLDKVGRLGWLRRVSGHYYVLPAVLAELAERARRVAAGHPQALLTVGQFREATGISRNMTLPLLAYFDARGLTARVADGRLVRAEPGDL